MYPCLSRNGCLLLHHFSVSDSEAKLLASSGDIPARGRRIAFNARSAVSAKRTVTVGHARTWCRCESEKDRGLAISVRKTPYAGQRAVSMRSVEVPWRGPWQLGERRDKRGDRIALLWSQPARLRAAIYVSPRTLRIRTSVVRTRPQLGSGVPLKY